jgi:hypothetical protein
VAVFRDTASKVLDAIKRRSWAGDQIAPVVIVWYIDPHMVDEQSDRLRELLSVGAGIRRRRDQAQGLEEQLIRFPI